MSGGAQLMLAMVAAVSSLVLGLLAYRRSRAVDAVSAQSGVAASGRAGTAQIIDALNGFIDQLQEDNRDIRDTVLHMAARLEALRVERDELKRDLARLRRKYGDNGDTPARGTPTTGGPP